MSDTRQSGAAKPPGRVLVVDPSGESRDFLRFCSARVWPDLSIVPYDFARGRPPAEFDWKFFDFIVLEQKLDPRFGTGIDWLRSAPPADRRPPIFLLTGAPDPTMRTAAERAGAAAYLVKDELTVTAFARQVLQAMAHPAGTVRGAAARGNVATNAAISAAPAALGEGTMPIVQPDSPASSAPAVDLGELPDIAGYRIERLIARGNVAAVYLARGQDGEAPVALKVLRLSGGDDRNALQRFMQEYEVLSRLRHEHVVHIHERGITHDVAFIAMEYCAAGDLKAQIGTGMPLPLALLFLRQIASGLLATHALNIVHRDLKPANILLRNPRHVLLTDFGIARDVQSTQRMTMVKAIIGSLYYVSPEAVRHDDLDHRADLYSAGAILHQMLTGQPPFKAANVTRMLDAHLNAPLPRLPPELESAQSLLDGLLAKNPDERFQSAAELIDGIDWVEKQGNAA